MTIDIKIKEGLAGLNFNSTTEDVRKMYGDPAEMEELDNPCDGTLESIVWNYPTQGLTFFSMLLPLNRFYALLNRITWKLPCLVRKFSA